MKYKVIRHFTLDLSKWNLFQTILCVWVWKRFHQNGISWLRHRLKMCVTILIICNIDTLQLIETFHNFYNQMILAKFRTFHLFKHPMLMTIELPHLSKFKHSCNLSSTVLKPMKPHTHLWHIWLHVAFSTANFYNLLSYHLPNILSTLSLLGHEFCLKKWWNSLVASSILHWQVNATESFSYWMFMLHVNCGSKVFNPFATALKGQAFQNFHC